MKRFYGLLVALVILAMAASPAFAQTATYNTKTTAALAQGATTVAVSSTTNMPTFPTNQTWNVVIQDGFGGRAELAKLTGVNTSSSTITLQRGQGGAVPYSHVSGAIVWFGPAGGSTNGIGVPFTSVSPQVGTTCTVGQFTYLPIVNYADGTAWHCRNSRYVNSGYGVSGVADEAFTATLGDYIIAYTTITAARTVTLPTPVAGMRGKVIIIKDQTAGTATYTIWVTGGSPDGSTSVAMFGSGGLQAKRYYTDGVGWFSW